MQKIYAGYGHRHKKANPEDRRSPNIYKPMKTKKQNQIQNRDNKRFKMARASNTESKFRRRRNPNIFMNL